MRFTLELVKQMASTAWVGLAQPVEGLRGPLHVKTASGPHRHPWAPELLACALELPHRVSQTRAEQPTLQISDWPASETARANAL